MAEAELLTAGNKQWNLVDMIGEVGYDWGQGCQAIILSAKAEKMINAKKCTFINSTPESCGEFILSERSGTLRDTPTLKGTHTYARKANVAGCMHHCVYFLCLRSN